MWYTYFLQNKEKDYLYIGSTNNLKRRVEQHENGYGLSTKRFVPLELVGYVALPNEYQVRKLEKYFKSGSGRAVLKKRILTR